MKTIHKMMMIIHHAGEKKALKCLFFIFAQ